MYQYTVPVFTHNLKNLSAMLKTAAKDAKARGIDPTVLLNSRLAPDMHPLVRQVQIATDHAKGCCARLAGVELPKMADEETTFADLEKRIKAVLAFIRTLKRAQFEGGEARTIKMKTPRGTITFSGSDYYNGFAMPNFYFHLMTTYAILRHNGVMVGKGDFLGSIPGMTATGKLAKMMSGRKGTKK